jgi:hypothetical protein
VAFDNTQLDAILERAASNTSYGFRIRTTNAYQLSIALRGRISAARRELHPKAYAHIMIISSKSPLELYIINKDQADAFRQTNGQAANSDPGSGLPLAEEHVSEVRAVEPGSANSHSSTHGGPKGEIAANSGID